MSRHTPKKPKLRMDRLYATQMGAYDPQSDTAREDREFVRQKTHDELIRMMGAERDGPVQWMELEGHHARKAINGPTVGASVRNSTGRTITEAADLAERDQLAAHIADGWILVVALAVSTRPNK